MSDYEVGYGKPPRHTQWKKGQSGNPKGRRRKDANDDLDRQANIESLIVAALGKRVAVRKGASKTRMTQREQLVRALFAGAIAGDPRLLMLSLKLVGKLNQPRRRRAPKRFAPADEEVLKALYARLERHATTLSDAEQEPARIACKNP